MLLPELDLFLDAKITHFDQEFNRILLSKWLFCHVLSCVLPIVLENAPCDAAKSDVNPGKVGCFLASATNVSSLLFFSYGFTA